MFSDRARELVEKCERQGGLSQADGEALIREGTTRIFKWTGQARDQGLYQDLSGAGFKIAADIACFESHHLNHLTPNTLCMDLYVAAMKKCLGEMDEEAFEGRASVVLGRLARVADRDWLRLHFRHLSHAEIDAYQASQVTEAEIADIVTALVGTLRGEPFQLQELKHAGFKDFTEGPSEDTPVLLRQDAYRALTEIVRFIGRRGQVILAGHTARFGEIEERFYATTPRGRALYDRCLAEADAMRDRDPGLPRRDPAAYETAYAKPFAAFPKTLPELLRQGLVYGRYAPTPRGVAARGSLATWDIHALVDQGFAQVEGLRYEDFLPVSAAGIFASNLNQYGTRSTAAVRPTYSASQLEAIMGRPIIDAMQVSAAIEARSLLDTWRQLGVIDRVPVAERSALEQAIQAAPVAILPASAAASQQAVASAG
ncbi:MAG: VOC family protein [Planctomycetes bacterium]|nr:VOC family protein [Planctomycetota bacterium]